MFDPIFRTGGGQRRAERYGNWLKALAGNDSARDWCIKNGVSLTKASVEGVDSAGGFLTPTDFDSDVVSIKETQGSFRQGAQVTQATSDSQVRPRRTGGLTANWVPEGSPIPTSQGQFDQISTASKKMGILIVTSSELLEDSAVDLGAWVASEVAYAFAGAEDDAGFNGDGTSKFGGISGLSTRLAGTTSFPLAATGNPPSVITAATGHNTFATLTGVDLANLVGGVIASAIPGSAWYVSNLAYAQTFCALASVAGGLAVSVATDGVPPVNANYLGWPVRFSSKLPNVSTSLVGQPMIFFGNLAMSSVIVERRQIVIGMSRQHAFDTDQVLIRATQRIDIVNHDCGSATTKGPVAMLVGTT
jgi:HK97 family phage major capsid protein